MKELFVIMSIINTVDISRFNSSKDSILALVIG